MVRSVWALHQRKIVFVAFCVVIIIVGASVFRSNMEVEEEEE